MGSGPDDGDCAIFVCVSPQILVEGVLLTNNRHADIARALGLLVSTSRAESVRCTSKPISIVKIQPSATPCQPYHQTAADEALRGEDDAAKLISTPSSPTVDISQHHLGVVATERYSEADQPRATPHRQPSETEGKEGPTEMFVDRPSPGDEMFYADLESPNTATMGATRHQEGSDNLFEADVFEPNVTEANPHNSHSYAEQNGQILEFRPASPVPWIQDRTQTVSLSQHVPESEWLGLERQPCTDQSETRRLRRRRSLHNPGWVVVKRQRMLDHIRV